MTQTDLPSIPDADAPFDQPHDWEVIMDKALPLIQPFIDLRSEEIRLQNEDKENERSHQRTLQKNRLIAEDKQNSRESKHKWGILAIGAFVLAVAAAIWATKEGSADEAKDLMLVALVGIFAFWAGGGNPFKNKSQQEE